MKGVAFVCFFCVPITHTDTHRHNRQLTTSSKFFMLCVVLLCVVIVDEYTIMCCMLLVPFCVGVLVVGVEKR